MKSALGAGMEEVLDSELFRSLMRRHAGGVVVVTATTDRLAGFTATSFTSVSLRPPLVAFCVAATASAWPVLASATHVGINVLADDQEPIARRFASSGIDRFAAPTLWRPGYRGIPVLDRVTAVLICEVERRVHVGDHQLIVARPLRASAGAAMDSSLVYHMGRYVPVGGPLPGAGPT
jgi:flavin reductase (DIM6/NTAB) family NADH-FMN oxidoreductase RutF